MVCTLLSALWQTATHALAVRPWSHGRARGHLHVLVGLAVQVRPPGGSQSPYYEDLAAAHATAEAQGLGIFNKVRQLSS